MTQAVDTAQRRKSQWLRVGRGTTLFFGVILPAGVILLELLTGFCASVFFDPIPTVWHVLLAAVVPVANLLAWRMPKAPSARYLSITGTLNAFAIVAAAYFTAMYALLTPLALIALIFLGMGLLPLSPGLSLLVALGMRWKMAWPAGAEKRVRVPGLIGGTLAGLLCVTALQAPRSMTQFLMQHIAENGESPTTLSLLRHLGNRDMMLKTCYGESDAIGDTFSWVLRMRRVNEQEARAIYYRVTGVDYQVHARPRLTGLFAARGRWDDDWSWDQAQGSDRVGPRIKKLSLRQSRIDGVVDATASLAYLEWTMVFRNDSSVQREARARLALPPGAVVSRATLWINGEEREAAFGGRDQTRRAYQDVAIVERRDPLLVTTAGPDRVQMQCFPIERDGGEMKVRLGITVPLEGLTTSESRMWLPTIAEQNFSLANDLRHSVWITAEGELSSESGAIVREKDGSDYALRGELSGDDIWGGEIRVKRNPTRNICWTAEPAGTVARRIVQELRPAETPEAMAMVIAVDLSRNMGDRLLRVQDLLEALPAGTRVGVLGASGQVIDASGGMQELKAEVRKSIMDRLRHGVSSGGEDNIPALEQAWELAAKEGCDVLWLHGAQPTVFKQTEGMAQRCERRPGTRIFSAQLQPGANKPLEELERFVIATRAQSAKSIIGRISGASVQRILRELEEGEAVPVDAAHTSAHLTRLWANARVTQMARSGKAGERKEALQLAADAQLVTPLTGAVVLETDRQYAEHNLTPADADLAPTIPEPTGMALAGVAVLILARRTRRPARVTPLRAGRCRRR